MFIFFFGKISMAHARVPWLNRCIAALGKVGEEGGVAGETKLWLAGSRSRVGVRGGEMHG